MMINILIYSGDMKMKVDTDFGNNNGWRLFPELLIYYSMYLVPSFVVLIDVQSLIYFGVLLLFLFERWIINDVVRHVVDNTVVVGIDIAYSNYVVNFGYFDH